MGNLAFGLSSASSGRSGELGVKSTAAATVALELGRSGASISSLVLFVVEFEAGDVVADLVDREVCVV